MADPVYIQNLTVRWPNLNNPGSSKGFWLYEWKKHGTCSLNLYPQQAYFGLAMQLHDKLNLLEVLAKSNINPGAISNHLLSQVNNSLVAYTSKVPDFKCQLNRAITTLRRNLPKEVVSCNNLSGTAIDCSISQRSNCCYTHIEPISFEEAMKDKNWRQAMDEEIQAIKLEMTMEGPEEKKHPSLPSNYVSLAHLKDRWLQQHQQQ
ncbi:hypothetical protein RJ640_001785 [Escallonia rubra]|uniref:Uncharacterized protein n=1 Tax=Escallonia rubra TaxID=112253 RepID=A0AA88U0X0_9ASTE|nr:hypothetical protein RJ640_001785 [Escallonia rubra]